MASPAQQKMRQYSYGFNGKSGYSRLLNTVHKNIQSKMEMERNKEGANKLQNFLQNIKNIARILMEQTSTRANKTEGLVERVMAETGELYNWYTNLVTEIVKTEANIREKKGLEKLGGNQYNLFKRAHQSVAYNGAQVDDILEEELAVLFAILSKRLSGKEYKMDDINIDLFTTGKAKGQIQGTSELGEKFEKNFVNGLGESLQEFARNQKLKSSSQVLGKEFKKEVAIKTDIQNLSLDINATFGLNNTEIDQIIPLLNEASFTAKNYLHSTIVKAGGVKLGETNLLRAIAGILGVSFPSNTPLEWWNMFYRGAQIMTKTNETPSASPEKVMQHFYHMRFAYELSGLGLLDSTTLQPLFTKYLIYNEPDGDKIYVFDTATLILEELGNKSVVNTFGAIHLQRRF